MPLRPEPAVTRDAVPIVWPPVVHWRAQSVWGCSLLGAFVRPVRNPVLLAAFRGVSP